LGHAKGDIIRAVMEGISCSLKQVGDLLLSLLPGVSAQYVIASGGGAASPLWRQVLADLFQRQVRTLAGSGEGGAYSAALLAGVGAGVYPTLADAMRLLRAESETDPIAANRGVYQDLLGIYTDLYGQLSPAFARMSK
jgi:xylulokinase